MASHGHDHSAHVFPVSMYGKTLVALFLLMGLTIIAARFNLGRILVALGRPRDAAEQFERILLPEDQDTPRFAYALSTACLAAGEIAKARKSGEQALQMARRLGQTELAARIEQHLEQMKRP